MVRTVIRPDDYVEFRDPDTKSIVFSTADSSRVYLSELDEGTAEVKSITVDVPAADGALDLTESVAGRPLYGNRTVAMTVSLVCADHPAAVAAVQSARRAIHGRMLEVETPDTRVSEGWYVGRVSIDSVKYPGEAAVLHITANCKPWVYYGTETVQLTSGEETLYQDGYITADADRRRAADMLLEIEQPRSGWDRRANYAYAGYPPSRIAIVTSAYDNLMVYGTMARWHAWRKVPTGEAGDSYDTGWVRDDSIISYDDGLGSITIDTIQSGEIVRVMFTSPASGSELGMMVTDMTDELTVNVTGDRTSGGTAMYGIGAGAYIVHQETVRPDVPDDAAGGLLANGTALSRTVIGDGASTVDGYLDLLPADVCQTYDGWAAGYIVAGVEFVGIDAGDVEITLTLHGVDHSTWYADETEVVYADLPYPLYSVSGAGNIVNVEPTGSYMRVYAEVPAGSDTAVRVPMKVLDVNASQPVGTAKHVRVYGVTNRGWKALAASVTLYPWDTVTFDAGDMPTTMSATLDAPTVFEVGGERFAFGALSGEALPFALAGEVELPYMALGGDGYLTFERGTV